MGYTAHAFQIQHTTLLFTHRYVLFMDDDADQQRKIGLWGATGIGVGAIVGGGILALAGVAFQTTGPSAILAFSLNGIIALLTALSIAEMASKFPESGGTYTFARKVLSIESAFTVGWVVWFASIVAAVLYAIGFAHFAILIASDLMAALDYAFEPQFWLKPLVAITLTIALAVRQMYGSGGGGLWENVGKVAVFGILIAGGLWALSRQPAAQTSQSLRPFFTDGWSGLVQAMGYTFIALQGFDLIVAAGGEVKEPRKNLPRAMVLSLLIALAIYVPLLFVITTVGTSEEESIGQLATRNTEGLIAVAAKQFLGSVGYWLVMAAALLSMYTALAANVFAASRIAMTMARDRTLPSVLSQVNKRSLSPTYAIGSTALIIVVLILALPNIAVAGAASSLIFLVTFAAAHWLSILVRQRSVLAPPFRSPLFPVVPIVGGLACLGLAVFQAVAVPTAGVVALGWLGLGGILFLTLFARRARFVDASSKGTNPELMTLRGRAPLVLVPIANPDNAEALIELADALVPAGLGRVLIHNVVVADKDWQPDIDSTPIVRSQTLLSKMLRASVRIGIRAEALTTVAAKPMDEIARVARLHSCDTVLVGLSKLGEQNDGTKLEWLLGVVDSDVVVLRSSPDWYLTSAKKILVPIAGQGGHDFLLARLLGSLVRSLACKVQFVRVVPTTTSDDEVQRMIGILKQIAQDNLSGQCTWDVIVADDPVDAIVTQMVDFDLLILGAQRHEQSKRLFGRLTRKIVDQTDQAVIIMSSQR